MYNCKICGLELIKGREYQYPPRLSYWYCPQCQKIYRECEGKYILYIGDTKDYKDECIQDFNSRGFIENTLTGEKSYPDVPTFNRKSQCLIDKIKENV